MFNLLSWENEIATARLTQRHLLRIKSANSRKKKHRQTQNEIQRLAQAVKQWKYRPSLLPPDIEVGWILHSQVAWKGTEITAEELWEDLPETDPARIIELDAAGPEMESIIPDETVFLLKRILDDLAKHGIDIRKERFSENWKLQGSGGNNKGKSSPKKPKPIKYTKVKPLIPKGSNKGPKKSPLLSDFFEINR